MYQYQSFHHLPLRQTTSANHDIPVKFYSIYPPGISSESTQEVANGNPKLMLLLDPQLSTSSKLETQDGAQHSQAGQFVLKEPNFNPVGLNNTHFSSNLSHESSPLTSVPKDRSISLSLPPLPSFGPHPPPHSSLISLPAPPSHLNHASVTPIPTSCLGTDSVSVFKGSFGLRSSSGTSLSQFKSRSFSSESGLHSIPSHGCSTDCLENASIDLKRDKSSGTVNCSRMSDSSNSLVNIPSLMNSVNAPSVDQDTKGTVRLNLGDLSKKEREVEKTKMKSILTNKRYNSIPVSIPENPDYDMDIIGITPRNFWNLLKLKTVPISPPAHVAHSIDLVLSQIINSPSRQSDVYRFTISQLIQFLGVYCKAFKLYPCRRHTDETLYLVCSFYIEHRYKAVAKKDLSQSPQDFPVGQGTTKAARKAKLINGGYPSCDAQFSLTFDYENHLIYFERTNPGVCHSHDMDAVKFKCHSSNKFKDLKRKKEALGNASIESPIIKKRKLNRIEFPNILTNTTESGSSSSSFSDATPASSLHSRIPLPNYAPTCLSYPPCNATTNPPTNKYQFRTSSSLQSIPAPLQYPSYKSPTFKSPPTINSITGNKTYQISEDFKSKLLEFTRKCFFKPTEFSLDEQSQIQIILDQSVSLYDKHHQCDSGSVKTDIKNSKVVNDTSQ